MLRRLDELTRDRSTDDLVLEHKSFAVLCRLDVNDDVSVLSLTA